MIVVKTDITTKRFTAGRTEGDALAVDVPLRAPFACSAMFVHASVTIAL